MDNCYECETLGPATDCKDCGGSSKTDKQQSVWKRCLKCGVPTRMRVVKTREPYCPLKCEPAGCGETKSIW